ncbi:MAG TPA: hypothetical protein VEI97_15710, partial [bacterium]|nr:hypothetical protein [bacterium]
VSLPSFQAYFTLGSSTALASAGSAPKADGPAATPPPIRVPGAEGIPEVPAPRLPEGFGQGGGAIEELPAGSTTPPSPNLVPSSRGAGALADALAAEEATEKKSGRSEVEYELGMPSGMGPQPRIRPFKVGTFERPHEDGTQEQVFYADLLNIRDPGTIQAAIGETVELPNTGFKAKVLEITDGGRRVVLEEIGRAVFVWRRAPGVKWYWDHADPANNQGRKSTGKSKAPAVRPR